MAPPQTFVTLLLRNTVGSCRLREIAMKIVQIKESLF